ncbi:MAG: DnaJ domain-containing protein [Deltaproteobacteria bacterium]|nr:DnaJ domain-containing protein [Deltaproteobacteria bacterium]
MKLKRNDLSNDGPKATIKTAYKKMAKIHHPDAGGNEDQFKKLNAAHEQMLSWAENPQYTSRKALQGCWSYDGFNSRWSPPL